jgi:hypothetical protein
MLRIVKCAVLAVDVTLPTLPWSERSVAPLVLLAPSDINDSLARLTAERLQASFNRTFIVENEPGGIVTAQRVTLGRLGVEPEIDGADDFAKIVTAGTERCRDIIRDMRLKIQ